jgi:hypothetical protein
MSGDRDVSGHQWAGLNYHHCRPLEFVVNGAVSQTPGVDQYFEEAYRWAERQPGFYPLFLAVGDTDDDIRMTGYQDQWRKLLTEGPGFKEYRRKGDAPNGVLFSFVDIPDGVYMDFQYWNIVLGCTMNAHKVPQPVSRWVFKPSWKRRDWLRYAKKSPGSVQSVVPSLDLSKADLISVRNQGTKQWLTQLGFANVVVRRLRLAAIRI